MSSAQLKGVEMTGSGGFGVNKGDFSSFWCFSLKPAVAGRDLRAAAMVVGTRGVGDDVWSSVGAAGDFVWVESDDFSTF